MATKNEGKRFEEDFANSFSNNVFIYRLKDTSSGWSNGGVSRFTVKNACDFIAYNAITNNILMIECKSFLKKSCPMGNVKKHQIMELYNNQNERDNTECYFILNFRDLEETYAVNVNYIYNLYINDKKSISHKFCIENGILIEQKKLKTRYSYNINGLFKDIKKRAN